MRVEATIQRSGQAIIERGKMLLRMKQLPGVDNLGNYPAILINELEDLLLLGGSALPDPNRKNFYDLKALDRTFFIHISPITGRVGLLATWLSREVESAKCSDVGSPSSLELTRR